MNKEKTLSQYELMQKNERIRKTITNTIFYTVGAIIAIVFLFPLIYMIVTSGKSESSYVAAVGTLKLFLPNLKELDYFIKNYATVFTSYSIWKYALNSFFYAAVVIVLNVLINGLAGYALSKFEFPGKAFFNFIIMFLIVVPVETSLVPLYTIVINLLGLRGNLAILAVILPPSISVFNIFLFIQFFSGIPSEYEEAARIDGAGNLRIFFSMILPLSKPIVATVATFAFIGVWNDYLWPTMILPAPKDGVWPLYPIQSALDSITRTEGITTGEVMASLVITSIPIFIVYVVAQKYIVNGFGTAGLKL